MVGGEKEWWHQCGYKNGVDNEERSSWHVRQRGGSKGDSTGDEHHVVLIISSKGVLTAVDDVVLNTYES